jgi:hypothetical protein
MVVVPLYWLLPDNVSVPAPTLVNEPFVEALDPEIVRFELPLDISIDDVVPVLSVKARSVDAVDPVYFSVPPPSTRFDALLSAAPRLPATPPFPIVPTLSVPAFIVVTPV